MVYHKLDCLATSIKPNELEPHFSGYWRLAARDLGKVKALEGSFSRRVLTETGMGPGSLILEPYFKELPIPISDFTAVTTARYG